MVKGNKDIAYVSDVQRELEMKEIQWSKFKILVKRYSVIKGDDSISELEDISGEII